jgi:transketolase
VGREGVAIGIDRIGASAPGPIVLEKLGISVGNVVDHAKKLVKK